MNIRIITLLSAFVLSLGFCHGQGRQLYETGVPVDEWEDNILNLIRNWKPEYVTNAGDYNILEWELVETIADSARYRHWRNYFSGPGPVVPSIARDQLPPVIAGGQIEEKFVRVYPYYAHPEYFDGRGTAESREIFSGEFRRKAVELYTRELNIEQMDLYRYTRRDSMWSANSYDYSVVETKYVAAAPPSETVKALLSGKKTGDDLSVEEARELFLETLLNERVRNEVAFNESVGVGDNVCRIRFMFRGFGLSNIRTYDCYIICSGETGRVVYDHFFLHVPMMTP